MFDDNASLEAATIYKGDDTSAAQLYILWFIGGFSDEGELRPGIEPEW
jgi:hypothetical protein